MQFLFVHRNAPAQFVHLIESLSGDGHHVSFASQTISSELPPRVRGLALPEPQGKDKASKKRFELNLYEKFSRWRAKGLNPDWIILHCGWGLGLSLKSVFPAARLLVYAEWWFNFDGEDMNYDPGNPDVQFSVGSRLAQVERNRDYAYECLQADVIVSPTKWQKQQLPARLQRDCVVIHDGCDINFFTPSRGQKNPPIELAPTLTALPSAGTPLITYATRGMDPYRGFPEWARAIAQLLQRRQDLHAAVAGSDRVVYAPVQRTRQYGIEAQALLAEAGVADRVHFLGYLKMPAYRWLLRRSTLHTYFTRPYVLSWSLLQAMACGCAILASDVAPVREVIQDHRHGLLVDHCAGDLHQHILKALEEPGWTLRKAAARRRVERHYGVAKALRAYYQVLFAS